MRKRHYSYGRVGDNLCNTGWGQNSEKETIEDFIKSSPCDQKQLSVLVYMAGLLEQMESTLKKIDSGAYVVRLTAFQHRAVADGHMDWIRASTLTPLPDTSTLSIRADKALRRARCEYLEDCTAARLIAIHGVGITTVTEIAAWLESHGYELPAESE